MFSRIMARKLSTMEILLIVLFLLMTAVCVGLITTFVLYFNSQSHGESRLWRFTASSVNSFSFFIIKMNQSLSSHSRKVQGSIPRGSFCAGYLMSLQFLHQIIRHPFRLTGDTKLALGSLSWGEG